MSEARLILTCGLPGAGKTTLARQLAADRGAVRLTKDEWLRALGSTPWDRPTGEKIEQELWRLAQDVLSLGLSVVLDFGLWARVERDEMRSVARGLGVGVELHYLDVPADELWRRIDTRNSAPPWDNEPIGRADLDEWLSIFQAPDAAELALFDPPPDSNRATTRQVEVSDLLVLRGLLGVLDDSESFAEKWLGGWPREQDQGCVALDEDAEIVGGCWYRRFDDPPELIIVVRPENQGQGVGRMLLPATVALAKDLGVWALKAAIKPANHGARRVLEESNFHPRVRTSQKIEYFRALDDQVVTPPTV